MYKTMRICYVHRNLTLTYQCNQEPIVLLQVFLRYCRITIVFGQYLIKGRMVDHHQEFNDRRLLNAAFLAVIPEDAVALGIGVALTGICKEIIVTN